MTTQKRMATRFAGMFCVFFALLTGVLQPETALAQTATYTGWLTVIYGDPPPQSPLPPRHQVWLSDTQGDLVAQLLIDEASARPFNKQLVQVTVQADAVGTASVGGVPAYPVIRIAPLGGGEPRDDGGVSAQLTGSQRYINIRCSFADVSTLPHDLDWYEGLLGDAYPGLGHYWEQTSYGNINLDGSSTAPDWYELNFNQSHYLLSNGAANLDALTQDCLNKANTVTPSIHFPNYVGINMFFDGDLDCCAWGGAGVVNIDGVTKLYQLTWLPAWVDLATIGHEMGHGFGLPHSSGPAASPPSGLNIYVSSWDIMSRSSSFQYSEYDSTYEFLPPGTIAYHLDMLNWIAPARRITVNSGEAVTITLDRLQLPPAGSNYLIARVPIGGSTTRFYTVEARKSTGYDQNTPGDAVVIHHVVVGRAGNAGDALVVDADTNKNVNDAGARWLPGETFNDPVGKIQISVVESTATGFTVYIANNVSPTAAPVRNYHYGTTITLRWNRVEWALGYRVQVDTQTSFNAAPIEVAANQLSLDVPLGEGTYYWRVCALRTETTCGSWSATESFRVEAP